MNRGTGKRKTSIARVMLEPKGEAILVNGKPAEEYFSRASLMQEIKRPLVVTGQEGKVGIKVKVEGGGMSGQAGAVRHGITRALLDLNPAFRAMLKPEGLITRDTRVVERKKPGLKKSRRRPQFSKR